LLEVLVLGHQQAAMVSGKLPDSKVPQTGTGQRPNVKGIRKKISEEAYQLLRQVLVEEQTHH
jgi:hypothetical protein